MNKYARRKDENHNPIEDAYRLILGDKVTDSSAWGGGAGDLFVSFGGEHCDAYAQFVEIKRDEKAPYTAAQIRFQRTHPGCIVRVNSVEDALAHAQQIRRMVKKLAT